MLTEKLTKRLASEWIECDICHRRLFASDAESVDYVRIGKREVFIHSRCLKRRKDEQG